MGHKLKDIIGFLDSTLSIEKFRDYGTNGLQVEGEATVNVIATGVSANIRFFEKAKQIGADLLVVHHGLFWGNGLSKVTGVDAERLGFLLREKMSLAGYHLPLDSHPTLGNNAGLADALDFSNDQFQFGNVRGTALGLGCEYQAPVEFSNLLSTINEKVCGGRGAPFVFPFGPAQIKRVGLCTGAASDMLVDAAEEGCDLFVTGELAERAGELARELKINLVAAGHINTEVFGAQRLVNHLTQKFTDLSVQFVDVESSL